MAKKPPTPTIKAIAKELEQNGNDNDNGNGSGENRTGNASDSSSDSTTSGQFDSASGGEIGSASGTTDGENRGDNGESGKRGLQSEPSAGDSTSSNSGTGTGTGSGSGSGKRRGRPAGSKNRTSASGTEKTTQSVEETISGRTPRKVKGATVEDEALASIPQTTRELIETVYAGAYWAVGQLTNYPKLWELKEGEDVALAKATEQVIASLGKRRANKTLKAINEYFPGMALAVTALVITVPRIQATRAINNGKRIQTNAARNTSGPTGSGNGDISTSPGVNGVSGNGPNGATAVRERPLTGADFAEFGKEFPS